MDVFCLFRGPGGKEENARSLGAEFKLVYHLVDGKRNCGVISTEGFLRYVV